MVLLLRLVGDMELSKSALAHFLILNTGGDIISHILIKIQLIHIKLYKTKQKKKDATTYKLLQFGKTVSTQ